MDEIYCTRGKLVPQTMVDDGGEHVPMSTVRCSVLVNSSDLALHYYTSLTNPCHDGQSREPGHVQLPSGTLGW